jgi:hypothetical protein
MRRPAAFDACAGDGKPTWSAQTAGGLPAVPMAKLPPDPPVAPDDQSRPHGWTSVGSFSVRAQPGTCVSASRTSVRKYSAEPGDALVLSSTLDGSGEAIVGSPTGDTRSLPPRVPAAWPPATAMNAAAAAVAAEIFLRRRWARLMAAGAPGARVPVLTSVTRLSRS